ncbi:NAD(P)-binding protein [Coniochaeta ligniaria NRRL 30616]|uniref:NAD(P)-binding protein n=1 Tax=Coniochaeta ligniaria NRRL 30616 TaxID=1408157 RepID=A0A1J7J0S7_9PEZI|nr:NAD(P)-binding protein [Coniochaeta ligniaria NRRL 30616]
MSTTPSPKTILVTGATGKQGGALIDSILASKSAPSFHLIAVTRDATSTRARHLATRPGVSVIQGDLSRPAALFEAAARPIWGVYSHQGKALVDAAAAHGVRRFVYSSGDRGGPERSAVDPTDVRNFAAKFRVEKHLEAAAARESERGMTFSILRPVTFFENLGGDLHGRGFARMWEQMGDKKLQFVSTADIGWFAAQRFLDPERYRNDAVTLVGDELAQAEAEVIFREVTGLSMPMAPCLIGSAVKFVQKGTVGDMFRWFEKSGYGGSVEECRAVYPQMKDFRGWLEENKGRWTA